MTVDLKYPRDLPWVTPHNLFASFTIGTDHDVHHQADYCRIDRYVKDLLKRLLKSFSSACSILEVSCGTAHFTRWLDEQVLRAIGLDFSRPMLEQAKHLKSRSILQGDALRLPFISASFDLVALITALEFTSNPIQALNEAVRLAKQGLILISLNAHGHSSGRGNRREGSIWEVTRLFTQVELRLLLREVVGNKPRILWQTSRPFWSEASPFIWGDFIGVAVKLS
ncbi:MAG: class I SAM-dependent methyltransferase [Anaerolineales bacterium]